MADREDRYNSGNIERIIAEALAQSSGDGFRLLVLGSGMGELIPEKEYLLSLPISNRVTEGHPMSAGVVQLTRGLTIILAGRSHHYEGSGSGEVAGVLSRFLRAGPRETLLLSAVGGLAPGLRVGDLVAHSDYLSPFPVRNLARKAQREPGIERQRGAYMVPADRLWALEERARDAGIDLKGGVYTWVTGPTYETRAEIGVLRQAGGDIVGMSAYPEIVSASKVSAPTLGVSLVTNRLTKSSRVGLDHLEVITASGSAFGNIRTLINCW